MLINLALGLPTMVVCLLFQTMLLVVTMRYYQNHRNQLSDSSVWSGLMVISMVMLLLVAGNLGQIAIWAFLFMLLGEFQTLNEAFYHSAVNFATLGYGDIVMSPEHKLLGPLQAVNGVLMIGVSTAALMSAFQDAIRKTVQARKH